MYIALGCFLASAAASICPSNDHTLIDLPGTIIWAIISGVGALLLALVLIRAHVQHVPIGRLQTVCYPLLSSSLIADASLATRAIVLHPEHPELIMLVLLVVLLGLIGILVLTRALGDYKALTIVPIWTAGLMVLDVMGGAIFFGEFRNFSAGRIMLFLFAVVVIGAAIGMQLIVEDYDIVPKKFMPIGRENGESEALSA